MSYSRLYAIIPTRPKELDNVSVYERDQSRHALMMEITTIASHDASSLTIASTVSRGSSWSWTRRASRKNIVLIFDDNRLSYATGVIRSTLHFNDPTHVHLHLVTTEDAFTELEPLLDQLGAEATLHDYNRCIDLTAALRPFADPHIHTSALCKLYLADLLPQTVKHALYIDTDATVAGPLDACTPTLRGSVLFAMSLDLGDACQIKPDRCWPLSLEFKPWPGLKCGNVPDLYRPVMYEDPGSHCTAVGEPEPAQVNGGEWTGILPSLASLVDTSACDRCDPYELGTHARDGLCRQAATRDRAQF